MLGYFYVFNIKLEITTHNENHTEDEKPQGPEGVQSGTGKQGFKKKHNNKHKSH